MDRQNLLIGVGVIIGIVLLTIVYQAAIVIPREKIAAQERALIEKARLERLEKLRKVEAYDLCIASAWHNYSANWDSACTIDGKEADCTLPAYRHEPINKSHEVEKDRCVTMYK